VSLQYRLTYFYYDDLMVRLKACIKKWMNGEYSKGFQNDEYDIPV